MATTTNYGWTTPDDTALVKDGASAIRSLGTAIDTAMNTALGTKKSGLVLLNTTSFSAVSSASLANDIFTSTYTNYRIIVSQVSTSANVTLSLRMRAAGVDNTANEYQGYQLLYTGGGITNILSNDPGTSLSITQTASANTNQTLLNFDIGQPKLTTPTLISGTQSSIATGGSRIFGWLSGVHRTATSFDSISISPSSGTLTCTISVYAYNN